MLNAVLIHTIGDERPQHLSEGSPAMVRNTEAM
jgi:hypothetical protein